MITRFFLRAFTSYPVRIKMGKKSEKEVNGGKKPNYELAKFFSELGDFEKNKNKAMHKYSAYRKAATAIMDHPVKIKSGAEAQKNLPGVGKKIALKIDEYIKKGTISKLEKERQDPDYQQIKELLRVTGIGPVAARNFIKDGIKSLDDLKAHQEKLTAHQKIGLKYVDDFESRIPREEMCLLRDVVFEEAKKIDENYLLTVCGSFRRGNSSSNDIDILITHPKYVNDSSERKDPYTLTKPIIDALTKIGFITDTLGYGASKFMGVCCLNKDGSKHRRLDMRIIPYNEYFCGLLYFTGSDQFNKNMRKIALEKGYTLNEYCLKKLENNAIKTGPSLKVTCEKDIFDYLGMEYKAPEERNV